MDKSSYLLQYIVLRPILQYVQIQTVSLIVLTRFEIHQLAGSLEFT